MNIRSNPGHHPSGRHHRSAPLVAKNLRDAGLRTRRPRAVARDHAVRRRRRTEPAGL